MALENGAGTWPIRHGGCFTSYIGTSTVRQYPPVRHMCHNGIAIRKHSCPCGRSWLGSGGARSAIRYSQAIERRRLITQLGEAACLSITFGTAWRMMVTRTRAQPNDVVVFALSVVGGSIAIATLQIAKLMATRVVAI